MSSAPVTAARPTKPAPWRVRLHDAVARWRERWTLAAVTANLLGQIVIVGTGGAVRLTASGLGCSTWPQCTPGQFTPEVHDATSFHPFVEFGNRTVSVLLMVVAVAVAVLVTGDRRRPRSYRWLGLVPVIGVFVQAVVGGLTVLFDLNPVLVSSHMLISMGLVALSMWLLVRAREGDEPPVALVDRSVRTLEHALWALAVVVLVLGVVTTGAGPHSGDEQVGYRYAVDPYTVAKVHAASVWLFVIVLAAMLWRMWRTGVRDRPWTVALVLAGLTLGQGTIGYVQLYTGLPIALVNLHLVGAACLTAGVVSVTGALRTRGPRITRADAVVAP
ncbi:COX15/CtaA family protein [Cellulomonas alba]|uniref:COX15/CtaA family protein n=1 Tax=Cellulomonas alba TaxID=3053467 RepID=A0ABT7SJY6_9CELL|nr:COX15/CtaA family protein [Cellulomonas alba]MDM7856494.1 COX15/CtaA family protein [Cellulomonas alba]